MVIRWYAAAERRLKEIFDYYLDAAGRKTAMKIAAGIRDSAESLGTMPFMASTEPLLEQDMEGFRSLIVKKQYKVIYFIEDEIIYVVDVWDCRQDPQALKKRVAGKE